MCIRWGFYRPKPGISVQEIYRYHIEVHCPAIMKIISQVAMPGFKRYVVGRVTREAVGGVAMETQGKPELTNYVKMWWEDEAPMNRYLAALKVTERPGDEFLDKVDWGFTAFVAEELIFENPSAGDTMATRLGFYNPKPGISTEEINRYHVEVHAPEIMRIISDVATPGLKRYVVGRVTQDDIGKAPLTNYVQMWWEDEAAMNRYLETLKTSEHFGEDFLGKVNWGYTAFVEEETVFEK